MENRIAYYHLPGLFEFYDFYSKFLPLYQNHREYFYNWCEIGSIYGAPEDALWGGGRVGFGDNNAKDVFDLMNKYNISSILTFSNSLLKEEHLKDEECNKLCRLFERSNIQSGIVIYSDLLLNYLKDKYPNFYYVSSTTKVILDFNELIEELNRDDFKYVVPDFRLNKTFNKLDSLSQKQKDKIEFLCNECCDFNCKERKACYENVSHKCLKENVADHVCISPNAKYGYRFSEAMKNPGFISINDILNVYMPKGFTNFKIEGRSLGSALLLEFILYYMTKPEYQLKVREEIYLDNTLDLF